MKRKIKEYYARLDAQFISYDAWIREREQEYTAAGEAETAESVETVETAESVETAEDAEMVESAETVIDVKMPAEAALRRKAPSVRIIEFSACGAGFLKTSVCINAGDNVCTAGHGPDDILIFANDRERLATDAGKVICRYFAEHPDCVLVYGDEDEWNSNCSVRLNPWFKPDFSPDTLLQYFYYGNAFAVRAEALHGVVWRQSEDCLANLYDMCLQLSFPADRKKVGHVRYVLYHAGNLKQLCTDGKYRDIRERYAHSMNEAHRVDDIEEPDKKPDKISIVIPSKDHPQVLEMCLESLINTAKNENFEIVVVDNGSSEASRAEYEKMKVKYGFNYIFEPMEFNFSRMCNMGAEAAAGKYLLFLNDDIEAVSEGWLAAMCAHASKAHVGAVGAKLYYPDSKIIQHAGITNLRLGPAHKLQFLEDNRSYYDGRNLHDVNVLAVTGACLMVRKEVFEQCGGFSEDMAVAFNDVELGFHLYELGYYNVQCNSVILYHHESLSRGSDEPVEKQVRLMNERRKLYEKHPDLYGKDPFYHPYLNNVILDADFSFAYEYPAWGEIEICEPKLVKNGLRKEWYNECLLYGFEHVDDLSAWLESPSQSGGELYFQGYQFIVGSDNACFKWSLLLKNTATEEIWELPYNGVFRPDLARNVAEKHASLCGFACAVEKKRLPAGKYQLGCMAVSLAGRQRLCRFVNKYTEV